MGRTILAFLIAWIAGSLLVSIANTHVGLTSLTGIGADIPTGVRFEAIMTDLVNFGPVLATLILIAFVIAFPVAGFTARLLGSGWRRIGYTLAGAVAVFAIINGITVYYNQMLDSTITPVASGRDWSGLLTLSLGGAAAGLIFSLLKRASYED
ncbi:MAG: hypothetical protein GYB36_05390 [Alphaproteobacteria bacterium]|nr:hypothetical protein [Alphaproteobacteria bacterium]